MKADAKRIERDIEEINKFNLTPGSGITRLTFTKEYMGALNYILGELEKIGADRKSVV